MPTAIWTGSLSFGMVVIPVRLSPASKKKAVRFHEIDREGQRVRHIRVSDPDLEWERPRAGPALPLPAEPPTAGSPVTHVASAREVAYDEIRKGYEIAPGEYVSMTRQEAADLAPERSRVIDVQQFVDVAAVDPIYFESRYYVVPDREWSSPFQLLRQTLAETGRMAIAWFTLRSRRYLSAIRPFGNVMLLTTMSYADEILPADSWALDGGSMPSDKELKMARLLIDTLSGPFEPDRYPDEHRQRVLDAIQAKTPSAATAPAAPSPTRVLDLMAALEASVKAAKAARAADQTRAGNRRRSRDA
jgi:DNA end-binding protein Ku